MTTISPLRDQRGVAVLVEVVLVSVVLAVVGFAVFQSHQAAKKAATQPGPHAPQTAVGLAASAAAIAEDASVADTAVAAGAEAVAGELSDTDADMDRLGSTADESF